LRESQLPELVDVSATRTLLHKLAEDVLAAEQFAANHELRLEVVPNGFATGWFPGGDGTDRRIKVVGAELVREAPGVETAEPIGGLDPGAARVLYAWWAFGDRVLRGLPKAPDESISEVILWPEHFDIAVILTTLGGSMNLGFSPGDDFCEEPYVYAGPWEPLTGQFWNASFGAYRTYRQITADAEPTTTATRFFDDARNALRADPRPERTN
jgi:hypothetical protein